MISSVKGSEKSLIESEAHRKFLESFESDLLRGIGKLAILKVIKSHGEKGVYGYSLLKDLKEQTNNMLIIKEGTLYPLLRNLENWEYKGSKGSKGGKLSLIKSDTVMENERARKYYSLTQEGAIVLSHLEGFFLKLLEAVSTLSNFKIVLDDEKYIYCENCKNQIDATDTDAQYCEICGTKINQKKSEAE